MREYDESLNLIRSESETSLKERNKGTGKNGRKEN
jgi:hypothetical protein